MLAAAAHLAASPRVDRSRLAVVGWSLGGGLAVRTVADHPRTFRALVGFSTGSFGLGFGAGAMPPTLLLSAGPHDAIPLSATENLLRGLRSAGVEATLYDYGHGVHSCPARREPPESRSRSGSCAARSLPRLIRMKVRFAPSPTGSLHIGNALGAVANRNFGGTMLLRIDDTDPARNVAGGEQAILDDLRFIGVEWDEGPVRQSDRGERYREAATALPERFQGVQLLRPDGTATFHLASVVDDIDFEITHVIRGNDHRPNEPLHRALAEALGARPPEYVHHGLILGPDGKKLSKRAAGASVASLREAGIPAEAVRGYLDELGIPRHDVHLDLARIRSLAVEVLAQLPDAELAARLDVPVEVVPALRGAHDLNEARALAASILERPAVSLPEDRETLVRFRELRAGANGGLDKDAAKAVVRELKAVGGNLRAVRRALTGRDSGPELWAVIAALPRDETLARVDAAL